MIPFPVVTDPDHQAAVVWVTLGAAIFAYDRITTYVRTHPRKHKKATR